MLLKSFSLLILATVPTCWRKHRLKSLKSKSNQQQINFKTLILFSCRNFSLNKTKLPEHLRNDPGKVKKLFALLAEIDEILKADEAGKNDDETVEVENGTAIIEASKESSESAVDGANSVSDIMDGNEDEVKALIDSEDNVGDNLFDADGQVDEYAKYSDEEDKIVEPDSKPKLEEFVEFVKNLI